MNYAVPSTLQLSPAVTIRRVRPGDRDGLTAFYSDLSAESLHSRFLGSARGLSAPIARSFCNLDHMHDEGFVALTGDPGHERIVGHLCLADAGASTLELGVAVADDNQGRGIGRALIEAALAWAHDRGYRKIDASCFADNSRVLALLRATPFGASITPSASGVVEVSINLEGPLPRQLAVYVTPQGQPLLQAGAPWRKRSSLSRSSRAVWQRMRPPAHGAAG
jgi:RimJ/RimL family protein N-acetyltransferase